MRTLRFAGYAALFGRRDAGRDLIRPGAFARTLAERRDPLPLFWQHRPDLRIGWIETAAEDERGLRVVASVDNPDGAAGLDWQTLERDTLYSGTIGAVSQEDGSFSAELTSRKQELLRDPVPRTSPSCRAAFCGPGCNLDAQRFTREVVLMALDPDNNAVVLSAPVDAALHAGGSLRWLEGPQAGEAMGVTGATGAGGLILDRPLDETTPPGTRAFLREGCDHTLGTCGARFANAANFRGEPFLPGNDLLTRYPSPSI